MNKVRQWWIAGAAVVVLVGVIGAGVVMAQTPSTTPTTPSGNGAAPSTTPGAGTFKSNEDPTHEAGESAEQEAAEDSGQFHGHGGRHGAPNEDPTHEANESPEREAQEDAGQMPGSGSAPSSQATPSSN